MADDYDYEHVKTFPTYASKLNDVDHFSGIQFRTNDPIVNRCKEKAKSNENFYYIMLCATLNKYFKYYSHLNPVDSKHCEYINFWLNKKSQYDNSFNIYKRIINHDKSLDIFDPSIKDIQEYESKLGVLSNEVVRKINTIYKLNEQYLFFLTKKEIGQTAKVILCDHAKKFAEIYNEAIGECSNYNNKYCKALIEFKVKYDKHKEFTKTCQEVKDVKIIPGTESYELEILRRYGLFSRYGFNSVTDVLKTAGKVLGGVFVLFLIIKFVPFQALERNKKRNKKQNKKKSRASSKHQKRDSRQDYPKHEDHDNYASHGSYNNYEDHDNYTSHGSYNNYEDHDNYTSHGSYNNYEDHDNYPSHGRYTNYEDHGNYPSHGSYNNYENHGNYANYGNYHDYSNYHDYNYYNEDQRNQVYNYSPYYNDNDKSVSHNGQYNIQYYSARDDEYMYYRD